VADRRNFDPDVEHVDDDYFSVSAPLALRPESETGAIAAPQLYTPLFQFGTRTAIQTLTGTVAAIFAFESYDRRLKVAAYSLRVMNSSASAVICRIWAIDEHGVASLGYPLPIEVEPFSVKSADIAIYPNDYLSFERAIAEVLGDGIHCIVEAAAPVRRKRGISPIIAASGFATALLTACTFMLFLSIPRISAFAAPPTATTGTSVDAEYSASGFGRLSYDVEAPDGSHVQDGVLDQHSGTLPIAIAASEQPGAYTLRLTMEGPLGTDKTVRVLNAIPPKVVSRGGAQISDIAVHPAVAAPGDTVTVSYAAAATTGYVQLMDSDGAVWLQKPFARNGMTQFVVPPVKRSREMRVLLHVMKAHSAAESSAGFLVSVPNHLVAASSASDASASDPIAPVASAPTDEQNGTFQLTTNKVASGSSIHVQIISPRNGMRISLMDTQSHEITGVDIGSDADSVTLEAPVVKLATRYIVQASFVDGFGQESVVEPITVSP
jgi:hypothetical protein